MGTIKSSQKKSELTLMNDAENVPSVCQSTPKPRHNRLKVAATVTDLQKARLASQSMRQFSKESGVPRTTLREWASRYDSIAAHPKVVEFCESPEGVQFLHEIATAAVYEFSKRGTAGLRMVSKFIRQSPMSPFVASSYGSIQKAAAIMEKNIIAFGVEQIREIASKMGPKYVSLCADESFFPACCLVAMDPVSGFIFVEEYSIGRDSKTWLAAIQKSIAGLPITILQLVSDEGKGLLCLAEKLDAPHSTDLFHGQREVFRGLSPTLRAMVHKALRAVDGAKVEVDSKIKEFEEYKSQIDERGPGRPPEFQARVETAKEELIDAQNDLIAIKTVQEELNAEVIGIGLDYHPFDLATGQARQAKQVETDLERRFENIHNIADSLHVSDASQKRIDKAERLLPKMVATITFFWNTVALFLAKHPLRPEIVTFLTTVLIPLAYLNIVLLKAPVKRRELIKATIAKLTKMIESDSNPLKSLDEETRVLVLRIAKECAEIFQRSSSCVEGRNGALSLHHHAGRSLSPLHLQALSVLYNFGIRRRDGTTAAERLSGVKHPDLYRWILERQPLFVRPARKVLKAA
jgi:hypothetical protein